MIVTAAMVWYSESEETLVRCARSLAGFCDELVALGGRWDGFPEIPDDDPEAQANALADACDEIGIEYQIGLGWWDSQVEKRADLMREATKDSDWVVVIDGDEYIDRGDPEKFRDSLAETEFDVARIYTFRIPISYGRNIQRVYRSSTKVTVQTAHNGYVTEDGRFLNGDPCYVDLMPTVELGEYMSIAHDLTCRNSTRKGARAAYLSYRRKQRIEAWT